MDRMSNMMGGLNLGDIQQYVQGIDFPIGKDDLMTAFQGKGAPSDLLDKVKGVDKSKFSSVQDFISSIQGS